MHTTDVLSRLGDMMRSVAFCNVDCLKQTIREDWYIPINSLLFFPFVQNFDWCTCSHYKPGLSLWIRILVSGAHGSRKFIIRYAPPINICLDFYENNWNANDLKSGECCPMDTKVAMRFFMLWLWLYCSRKFQQKS